MDTFRTLSSAEFAAAYDEVFTEAFPPEELKPLFAMERMIAQGQYEALGFVRSGRVEGYACCWLDGDVVLLDYLCVPASQRSGGIGSAMIAALLSRYEGGCLLAEAEAPTGDADADAMIERRLGFYRRSGGRMLGYDTALFGVHYKTICWGGEDKAEEELLRRHDGFYRRNIPAERYAAFIQIPLPPGESPVDRVDWEE